MTNELPPIISPDTFDVVSKGLFGVIAEGDTNNLLIPTVERTTGYEAPVISEVFSRLVDGGDIRFGGDKNGSFVHVSDSGRETWQSLRDGVRERRAGAEA